jgi:hypothetical protein
VAEPPLVNETYLLPIERQHHPRVPMDRGSAPDHGEVSGHAKMRNEGQPPVEAD